MGNGGLPGSFLPEILVNVLGRTVDILVQWIEYILSVLVSIIDFLGTVARIIVDTLQKIGRLFSFLWSHAISPLIGRIAKLLQTAHRFLEAHLRPVINFLKRVRAIIDRYYRQYLKPYLNMIQRVRRYLLVLKLLHVKWAQKLDARLARQEAIVTRIFLDVRSTVNMLLNTAESLTDPRKLSRWVLASVAGRRVAAASVRALTGMPLGHFAPSNAVGRFAWEHQPLTKRDYTDPRFNPPPSVIMAGLFVDTGDSDVINPNPPDDATLDAAVPLDYFDNIVESLVAAEDFWDDLDPDDLSITDTLEQQTGTLFTGAQVIGSFVSGLAAS